ncbi:MAG TPA: hypothetical protein VK168_05595 [Saprospiraceae bacterium]|nr:hypothetical protein [Saprospiraceae bacterium]
MVRLFFPVFFLWASVCQALTPISRDWPGKETAFEQTAPPYSLNIRFKTWK